MSFPLFQASHISKWSIVLAFIWMHSGSLTMQFPWLTQLQRLHILLLGQVFLTTSKQLAVEMWREADITDKCKFLWTFTNMPRGKLDAEVKMRSSARKCTHHMNDMLVFTWSSQVLTAFLVNLENMQYHLRNLKSTEGTCLLEQILDVQSLKDFCMYYQVSQSYLHGTININYHFNIISFQIEWKLEK